MSIPCSIILMTVLRSFRLWSLSLLLKAAMALTLVTPMSSVRAFRMSVGSSTMSDAHEEHWRLKPAADERLEADTLHSGTSISSLSSLASSGSPVSSMTSDLFSVWARSISLKFIIMPRIFGGPSSRKLLRPAVNTDIALETSPH